MRRLSSARAAKIAVVAVLAATAAGIGVLVWVLVATGGPAGDDGGVTPTELSGLTLEAAYARVAEAIARPGFVLHSRIESATRTPEGKVARFYTYDVWVDASRQSLREEFHLAPERDSYDLAEEGVTIVVGDYVYIPDDPDEALRFEVEDFCPGTGAAVLSRLLQCGEAYGSPSSREGAEGRIEHGQEYGGRPAVAVVFEEQATDPPSAIQGLTVSRLFLDPETFLPIARVVEYRQEGELRGEFVSAYEHEFVPADSLLPTSSTPVPSATALRTAMPSSTRSLTSSPSTGSDMNSSWAAVSGTSSSSACWQAAEARAASSIMRRRQAYLASSSSYGAPRSGGSSCAQSPDAS